MNDALQQWSRWWRAAVMMGEAAEAAGHVINRRSEIIAEGMRDPLHADWVELNRMVSEKAFGALQSWSILAGDAAKLQASMFVEGQRLGHAWLSGSTGNWQGAARLADSALTTGVRAFTPLHKAVTGNRRRLSQSSPRAGGR
ncbi:hypothetical protein HMF7854_01910 [Sphingomonas ginkgonis]|uniref:Phasin domain-containing protein n=1 Tax=Sphingomonas ginkgonis TaxID=2315330 RepID=A0A429V703_9SPHN|nr:hypothetical protein [Sphingomonas ginkgonis]RST29720.1 hypothetical protein HMF7854_01910 [Sphingomonas ginkgonis]